MGFKPTRTSQVQLQTGGGIPNFAGLRPTGIETAAKELSNLSQTYIKRAYNSAARRDKAEAALAGLDIVDPETGGIRQDLAEKAEEFWSSEGQTQYEATRDTSITNRMVVQLEAARDTYLMKDKLGIGVDGKNPERENYDRITNELRKQVESYPQALSMFDANLEKVNTSIELAQAKSRQEIEFAKEYDDNVQAATLAVELIGSIAENDALEDDVKRKILSTRMGVFNGIIEDITLSPAKDVRPGHKARTLLSLVQTKTAEGWFGSMISRQAANLKKADAFTIKGAEVYARKLAQQIRANGPAFLKEVIGDENSIGIDLSLIDIDTLANSVEQLGVKQSSLNSAVEAERQADIQPKVDQWLATNIYANEVTTDSLKRILNSDLVPIAKAMDAENPWKIVVKMRKAARTKLNGLLDTANAQAKLDERQAEDAVGGLADFIRTGVTSDNNLQNEGFDNALARAVILINDENTSEKVKDKLRDATAAASLRNIRAEETLIQMNMSAISARPNTEESRNLIEKTNELVEKLSQKEAGKNSAVLTQWSDFKNNNEQVLLTDQIRGALERHSEGKPLVLEGVDANFSNIEDIRELNTEMNLGLEALIERSITANENLVFKHTFNEQVENWIAKTDPTNVMLTRTPESAEEELSKLKEKMEDLTPNLSSDIDADTKFAQMESRLIDYTKKWQEADAIRIRLESVSQNWMNNNPTAGIMSREDIQKHDPPPNFDLTDNGSYPEMLNYVMKYGIIPDNMIEALNSAFLTDEEGFDRSMSFFSNVVGAMVVGTGRPKEQIVNHVLAQMNGAAGSRYSETRVASALSFAIESTLSYDEIKDAVTKGNYSTANTIAKGHVFPEAGMDSDDVKAFDSENDALFEAFSRILFNQSDSSILQLFGFSNQRTEEAKQFYQWLESTKGELAGKTMMQSTLEATPALKYQLLSIFRHELQLQNQTGTMTPQAVNGAVQRTMLRLGANFKIENQRVGSSLLTPVAPADGAMDWILPDIPDVIKAPLKAMGVMDRGVYAPRLVVNPASDQLIKTGLPATLHPKKYDILANQVLRGLEHTSDEQLNRIGANRNDLKYAIENGYVDFVRTSSLGNLDNLDSYKVIVRTGIRDGLFEYSEQSFPIVLFPDFVPNYQNDQLLTKLYNDALGDGVDAGYLNKTLLKINSYNMFFGAFAVRQAVMNELNNATNVGRPVSSGLIVNTAINTLARANGLDPIEMTNQDYDRFSSYFDVFTISDQ